MPLRIAFAGTPDFAVPSLQALIDSGNHIVAVYTQPDKPAGRGRKLTASPIKTLALSHNIEVRQPTDLHGEGTRIKGENIDVLIVVAYGLILPKAILELPKFGCINIHASLLPRWRGAAPIHRAIESGDKTTGISLMMMNSGLDTGPIIKTYPVNITPSETFESLHDKLALLGASGLKKLIPTLIDKPLLTSEQEHSDANYARKIKKSETWLDWKLSSEILERKIRAYNSWPLARSKLNNRVYLMHKAQIGPQIVNAPVGSILKSHAHILRIQAGDGTLEIQKIQLAGHKAMEISSFLNGNSLPAGSIFSDYSDANT